MPKDTKDTFLDLDALERLLAKATKTACDRATPCTSLCWRSVPACVPSAAVQRVLAERDALRDEVERMRAVVEAAEAFASHFDADDASQYGARRSFTAFYAALDAAKEAGR